MALTDHGTEVTTQLKKAQQDFARLLFADLPDRQLDGLRQGLEHVLVRLRETVAKGEPLRRCSVERCSMPSMRSFSSPTST